MSCIDLTIDDETDVMNIRKRSSIPVSDSDGQSVKKQKFADTIDLTSDDEISVPKDEKTSRRASSSTWAIPTSNRFELLADDISDPETASSSSSTKRASPYVWTKETVNSLLRLVVEQRVEQLSSDGLMHPVNLDHDRILRELNYTSEKPITREVLLRKLRSTKYRNCNYNQWRDEILQIIEERQKEGSQIGSATYQNKYNWTEQSTALLIKLAKEQRVQQLSDPTIIKHPANYNLEDLVTNFNNAIDVPATKKQIQKKMHQDRIYISSDYQQWRAEIEREKQEPTTFSRPKKSYMSNGGKWTETEEAIGQQIIGENEGTEIKSIIDKIYEALENRTRPAIYHRFFVMKAAEPNSSAKSWTETEDEAVLNVLSPFVANRDSFEWNSIFDKLKKDLPGRSTRAIKSRWTNFLDPNLDFTAIETEEGHQIMADFYEYGFQFSYFESSARSTVVLRRYIGQKIVELHQLRTCESIFSFLFRKLNDAIKDDNVSITDWLNGCTDDKGLQKAYRCLLYNHRSWLLNSYGIALNGSFAFINSNGMYATLSKQRTRTSMTISEKEYIRTLIQKYRSIDRHSLPVFASTAKWLTFEDGVLRMVQSNIQAKPISKDSGNPLVQFELSLDGEIEDFQNNSDEIERYGSNQPYFLYSFGLPGGRTELSFSKYYPIDTIINGLRCLASGLGCRSWREEIVNKRQDFILDDIKVIVSCTDYTTAFHSKFMVLSLISNAANVRRLTPKPLVDPDNFLLDQLTDLNLKIK